MHHQYHNGAGGGGGVDSGETTRIRQEKRLINIKRLIDTRRYLFQFKAVAEVFVWFFDYNQLDQPLKVISCFPINYSNTAIKYAAKRMKIERGILK